MSLQIAVEKVRWLAAGLLELNGCDADIAQDVAEHMIEAERYGFASHGVTLLPKYLENIARGDVTANARPECLTSEGNLQRFHAHNGFGQHAGKVAVNAAIEQAKRRGDAPRDKCTLSCAINGIHAAFHYLKKNYISGCVMTVPTG